MLRAITEGCSSPKHIKEKPLITTVWTLTSSVLRRWATHTSVQVKVVYLTYKKSQCVCAPTRWHTEARQRLKDRQVKRKVEQRTWTEATCQPPVKNLLSGEISPGHLTYQPITAGLGWGMCNKKACGWVCVCVCVCVCVWVCVCGEKLDMDFMNKSSPGGWCTLTDTHTRSPRAQNKHTQVERARGAGWKLSFRWGESKGSRVKITAVWTGYWSDLRAERAGCHHII